MAKTLAEHNYNGIDATIIADSINEFGDRITSFVCTFPRIVLAEFNTHRVFSRNSASSRAVPTVKMLEKIKNDPFIPIAWQKNHSGMQGTEYFTEQRDIDLNVNDWLIARDNNVKQAEKLLAKGATKQVINRLLEPFMWHTVICTATEYQNFFKLRCPEYEFDSMKFRSWKDVLNYHEDAKALKDILEDYSLIGKLQSNSGGAEIHISRLAEMMWDEYNNSEPKALRAGEWHTPFGNSFRDADIYALSREGLSDTEIRIAVATARCARVSYFNFEGKDDYEADLKLYERLSKMEHASPFEHCARAMTQEEYQDRVLYINDNEIFHGISRNFKGFIQNRELIGQ